MKKHLVRYTPEAAEIIKNLHPQIKILIREAIDEIATNAFRGNELQFELKGFRSTKAKRYRIIYKFNDEKASIDIYYVGHRRDVYEIFHKFIKSKQ